MPDKAAEIIEEGLQKVATVANKLVAQPV